jgi:hypothetical protein
MESQAGQTLLLVTMIGIGISSVLRVFADGADTPRNTKFAVLAVAAAAWPILSCAMYIRPAAAFFELTPLSWQQWGKALLVAGTACAVILFLDYLAGGQMKVNQEGQVIGSPPG